MAPQPSKAPEKAGNDHASDHAGPIGPPSGLDSIPTQYISEQGLRQMLKNIGYDEAREDTYRLKGVQLIDSVRESLQLPVKTFDTAAMYYHKFRIRYPSSEYNYEDVALASLFVACKVEDTIKKSKEILCAAHNLKQLHDNKTADDKIFEQPSRFTVGLERHILETIGFDFRAQYPQKLLIKLVRSMFSGHQGRGESREDENKFFRLAYDMSIDLYKTFAPIKESTFTLVLAILELTVLLTGESPERLQQFRGAALHTNRTSIIETMLDLMDLYTQFAKHTKVGPRFDKQKLLDVKIDINGLMSKERCQRHYGWCERCVKEAPEALHHPITPGSATSPPGSSSNSVKRKVTASEGTLRFVFDAELARKERELISEHHNDEYEEYEVEVEETIPRESESSSSRHHHSHSSRSSSNHHHGSSSRNHHGSRDHNNDHGWAPYQRNRHGGHPDRPPKGRKGGGGGHY
ncbi:hypothetical protein B0H63DRAFT_556901 [Podospora didyma]|uniref:RNA polymerase II holoenzyme cyclin-like subunit n=1 Tax=Podospora didyma TaxID=330526 RepID=A0AAE0NYC9_9PEZI|nr:hypothetical protein B0H63DRAFT_556901 [Podospora didyma]